MNRLHQLCTTMGEARSHREGVPIYSYFLRDPHCGIWCCIHVCIELDIPVLETGIVLVPELSVLL